MTTFIAMVAWTVGLGFWAGWMAKGLREERGFEVGFRAGIAFAEGAYEIEPDSQIVEFIDMDEV